MIIITRTWQIQTWFKMMNFIAKINTPHNGLMEFYFASIKTIHGEKYFVTTIDRETKSHIFYMKIVGNAWKIDRSSQTILSWILELESDLAQQILQKG